MLDQLPLWAQISEVIASVAVLISLIYLGFQVRDSSRATRTAAINAAAASTQNWYITLGSNPETSKLFFTGMRSPEELSEDEQRQFIMLINGAMLGFQNTFLMAQQGTLDVETQQSITNTIIAGKDAPGWPVFWNERKSFFNPAFQALVEDLMRQKNESGMTLYTVADREQE
jgi:hypothetical protein